VIEEAALALETPSITRERTVGADRAMARDHDRDRIRAVRMADSPRRVGTTEAPCNLAVGACRAPRYRAQLPPYVTLKRRRADIERQVEAFAIRVINDF